jgi:carbonic anhydrase/acetyltransferase-like protein (isoleucine patch superfamily)
LKSFSIYLFEKGFSSEIPGFKKLFPVAAFPFWGEYLFIDFALSNFQDCPQCVYLLVTDNRTGSIISSALSRWPENNTPIILLEKGIKEFINRIENENADFIFLSTLSTINQFDPDSLIRVMTTAPRELLKFSIETIPVDIYGASRKVLLKVLRSFPNLSADNRSIASMLFDHILHTSFDFRLVSNMDSSEYNSIIKRFREIKSSDKPAIIRNGGVIKNSIISGGSQIDGYVENSLIFKDVNIRRRARVINSIVMNHNRIGAGSVIYNSLILPCVSERAKNSQNIGEQVYIGSKNSNVSNQDFPDQINGGITVVGMDAEIPNNCVIEAGCFVAADLPHHKLRDKPRLRRGSSIFTDKGR